MNKNKNFGNQLFNLASEFIEVLYKIFKGIFFLIPVLLEKIKRLFRFSLSFKISLVYSILIFLSLMFFSILMLGYFTFTIVRNTNDTINSSISDLNNYVQKHPIEEIQTNKENIIITGETILYIYDTNKDLIYKSDNDAPDLEFKIPLDNFNMYMTFVDNKAFLSIINTDENILPSYFIMGAMDVKPYMINLAILALILGAASLLIFIFLPFFGFKLSKNMLRPIKKMTLDAKEISLLNLDKRLDVTKSQDELKDLSETFNEMLDRLQNSYEKQYQFISDASHELRTPISVIQGYANLLNRWGKDDKKVLDESVEAIKTEAENMKDLIEKLLFIARSESKSQPLEKTLFNVNELFAEIIKEYKVFDLNHNFFIDAEKDLSLYGDRKLIKQAVRIFIDNSIKFTPDQGSISLRASVDKNKLIITIKDTGAGISEKDLPNIFDRFYRADTSREKISGGSGLGLSIAKVILDLHDAKIKVFSKLNEGTEIQLLFNLK